MGLFGLAQSVALSLLGLAQGCQSLLCLSQGRQSLFGLAHNWFLGCSVWTPYRNSSPSGPWLLWVS